MTLAGTSAVESGLDARFRRESGRILAALVRRLGPDHLALAEDVVQDALLSAMSAWRFGLPEDPTAWLPERRQIFLVGGVAGTIAAALIFLQIREFRQRRRQKQR